MRQLFRNNLYSHSTRQSQNRPHHSPCDGKRHSQYPAILLRERGDYFGLSVVLARWGICRRRSWAADQLLPPCPNFAANGSGHSKCWGLFPKHKCQHVGCFPRQPNIQPEPKRLVLVMEQWLVVRRWRPAPGRADSQLNLLPITASQSAKCIELKDNFS